MAHHGLIQFIPDRKVPEFILGLFFFVTAICWHGLSPFAESVILILMKHKRLIVTLVPLGLLIITAVLVWQYWPTLKTAMSIKKHGVYGRVTLLEGNCMPSIGSPSKSCQQSPVSRTVYFYQPPLSTESMTGTHYAGKVTPTATARSDGAGNYQIDLHEGQYSVLIEDTGGPFCYGFSGTIACPITVTGTAQEQNITIDHAAH